MSGHMDQIQPDALSDDDRERMMGVLLSQVDSPRLVGGGQAIDLPKPIFDLLVDVLTMMRYGRRVILLPEDEEVSTQRAADILGVSRPHVVRLLKDNRMAYRSVGTHRRIRLAEIERFMRERDYERRHTLDELFGGMKSEGAYE